MQLTHMRYLIILLVAFSIISCKQEKTAKMDPGCSDGCEAKTKSGTTIACKLTSAELRHRKETVIASLKKQVIEKKETASGYAFKFSGSDKIVDELAEFVKTERVCCDFFTFHLSIAGDSSEAWLEMTGPEGTKDFIVSELGF